MLSSSEKVVWNKLQAFRSIFMKSNLIFSKKKKKKKFKKKSRSKGLDLLTEIVYLFTANFGRLTSFHSHIAVNVGILRPLFFSVIFLHIFPRTVCCIYVVALLITIANSTTATRKVSWNMKICIRKASGGLFWHIVQSAMLLARKTPSF